MDSSRLSPAARALLSDLKKVSGTAEHALLEQAVLHYYSQVFGKKALHTRLARPLEGTPELPSPEQTEVLSWLSDAFATDPVPLEPAQLAPGLPSASLVAVPAMPEGRLPAPAPSTDTRGWALPDKPDLARRRHELRMSTTQLAQESGLFEENIVSLEAGGLLWLSLQEQWALASALNWSLEQLQEALEKNLL